MFEIIKSFFVGFAFGSLCLYFKLPIPAPGAMAGVVGIVGVFMGYFIWSLRQ